MPVAAVAEGCEWARSGEQLAASLGGADRPVLLVKPDLDISSADSARPSDACGLAAGARWYR